MKITTVYFVLRSQVTPYPLDYNARPAPRRGRDLKKNLMEILSLKKEEGFPIPRYLIINKEGKIISPDASRPSNMKVLSYYLNKLH